MQVLIHSKTPVTKALRRWCERQARRLQKGRLRLSKVEIFLDILPKKRKDEGLARAKFKLCLPGKDLVISRRAADVYQAVVAAAERSERQLRKRKEKILGRRQHAAEEALAG